jgi:hypothetical protein
MTREKSTRTVAAYQQISEPDAAVIALSATPEFAAGLSAEAAKSRINLLLPGPAPGGLFFQ